MVRQPKNWTMWMVAFLCACSSSVPVLPVQRAETLGTAPAVLVIRPGGYKLVDLTREEFQQGMRMLYAHGPLPGLPRGGRPQLIFVGDDPTQRLKAEGYLQYCQQITGKRSDCWDDLNASGGLDDEGATFVALHFALAEALEDAASAVQSMTPTQVRAILSVMFLGMIVELLSPEPVTKVLFMVSMTSLIAFVGVDIFNHVVKGFVAMIDELRQARDFEGVRAAGIHYGQRIGPTVARIVVMVATYGIAKLAGLFKGSVLDLPGGSRAAALAEAQGFRLPAVESARSVALAGDGSVVIDLGAALPMAAAGTGISVPWNRPAELAQAGKTPDREGLTRAGRALEKHGGREGSVFPKATGNVEAKNQQGQRILEEILGDPATTSAPNKFGGRDYFSTSGRGARFNQDGSFRGFLEPVANE